jgi:hypothetical protein
MIFDQKAAVLIDAAFHADGHHLSTGPTTA